MFITVISLLDGVKTGANMDFQLSVEFEVKVEMHQSCALTPFWGCGWCCDRIGKKVCVNCVVIC